jgi:hypothetical protein
MSGAAGGHGTDTDTGHGHRNARTPDARPDISTQPQADVRPDTLRPRAGHGKPKTARTPDVSAGHAAGPDADTDTHEPDTDMDTEAAALAVLSGEPDISGAELGRRLGLSDRQGRRILKALSAGGRT